jgi:hypothetical protein
MWLYTFTPPLCLHGIVLNWLSTGTTLPFLPLGKYRDSFWNRPRLLSCTSFPILRSPVSLFIRHCMVHRLKGHTKKKMSPNFRAPPASCNQGEA